MATVTSIQNALNRFPSNLPRLAVDGVMGSKTTARIREFQQLFGLPVTGSVNSTMLTALGLSGSVPISGWNGVTGNAGAYNANSAQIIQATAMAVQAAAAAAQAAAAQGGTEQGVTGAARAAALSAWQGVTGDVVGYRENEAGILRQAAWTMQDLASIVTIGAIPAGTPGADTWSGVSPSAALNAAASNIAPVGIGALLGGSTAILIGGAILLVVLLAKR